MQHSPHTVSDVMTQMVVSIGREATSKEIAETMAQWKVSALPVLEGEGRMIGVAPKPTCCPRRRSGRPIRICWNDCGTSTRCAKPVR